MLSLVLLQLEETSLWFPAVRGNNTILGIQSSTTLNQIGFVPSNIYLFVCLFVSNF